eukprot:gene11716-34443_t
MKAKKQPLARRPTGFWSPFNEWYRSQLSSSIKPAIELVSAWYNENAETAWPEADLRPSWKETKQHAKCLRSTDEVKTYFQKYRASKKELYKKTGDGDSTGGYSTHSCPAVPGGSLSSPMELLVETACAKPSSCTTSSPRTGMDGGGLFHQASVKSEGVTPRPGAAALRQSLSLLQSLPDPTEGSSRVTTTPSPHAAHMSFTVTTDTGRASSLVSSADCPRLTAPGPATGADTPPQRPAQHVSRTAQLSGDGPWNLYVLLQPLAWLTANKSLYFLSPAVQPSLVEMDDEILLQPLAWFTAYQSCRSFSSLLPGSQLKNPCSSSTAEPSLVEMDHETSRSFSSLLPGSPGPPSEAQGSLRDPWAGSVPGLPSIAEGAALRQSSRLQRSSSFNRRLDIASQGPSRLSASSLHGDSRSLSPDVSGLGGLASMGLPRPRSSIAIAAANHIEAGGAHQHSGLGAMATRGLPRPRSSTAIAAANHIEAGGAHQYSGLGAMAAMGLPHPRSSTAIAAAEHVRTGGAHQHAELGGMAAVGLARPRSSAAIAASEHIEAGGDYQQESGLLTLTMAQTHTQAGSGRDILRLEAGPRPGDIRSGMLAAGSPSIQGRVLPLSKPPKASSFGFAAAEAAVAAGVAPDLPTSSTCIAAAGGVQQQQPWQQVSGPTCPPLQPALPSMMCSFSSDMLLAGGQAAQDVSGSLMGPSGGSRALRGLWSSQGAQDVCESHNGYPGMVSEQAPQALSGGGEFGRTPTVQGSAPGGLGSSAGLPPTLESVPSSLSYAQQEEDGAALPPPSITLQHIKDLLFITELVSGATPPDRLQASPLETPGSSYFPLANQPAPRDSAVDLQIRPFLADLADLTGVHRQAPADHWQAPTVTQPPRAAAMLLPQVSPLAPGSLDQLLSHGMSPGMNSLELPDAPSWLNSLGASQPLMPTEGAGGLTEAMAMGPPSTILAEAPIEEQLPSLVRRRRAPPAGTPPGPPKLYYEEAFKQQELEEKSRKSGEAPRGATISNHSLESLDSPSSGQVGAVTGAQASSLASELPQGCTATSLGLPGTPLVTGEQVYVERHASISPMSNAAGALSMWGRSLPQRMTRLRQQSSAEAAAHHSSGILQAPHAIYHHSSPKWQPGPSWQCKSEVGVKRPLLQEQPSWDEELLQRLDEKPPQKKQIGHMESSPFRRFSPQGSYSSSSPNESGR